MKNLIIYYKYRGAAPLLKKLINKCISVITSSQHYNDTYVIKNDEHEEKTEHKEEKTEHKEEKTEHKEEKTANDKTEAKEAKELDDPYKIMTNPHFLYEFVQLIHFTYPQVKLTKKTYIFLVNYFIYVHGHETHWSIYEVDNILMKLLELLSKYSKYGCSWC